MQTAFEPHLLLARLGLAVALLAGWVSVWAQPAPGGTLAPLTVTARGNTDPVEKSYVKMVRGMDLFEQHRVALAPGARLRYKLLPRRPDSRMDDLRLQVLGRTVERSVPVAADHTFTLERDPEALAENAVVVLERRAMTMTWRTEIRSPGVPEGQRRLGDLRLECEVGLEAGLVSNVRSVLDEIANALTRPGFCKRNPARYYFFAERPLFAVTLVHGERRHTLPVAELYAGLARDPLIAQELPYCDCEVLLDRTYFLPLGDASWPDDTRVEYEYMEDAR